MSDRPRFALPNPTESILWRRNIQKEGKYAAIVTLRREERQKLPMEQSKVHSYMESVRQQETHVRPDYGAVSYASGYTAGPLDHYKREESIYSTQHAMPTSTLTKSISSKSKSGGEAALSSSTSSTTQQQQQQLPSLSASRNSAPQQSGSLAYLVNRRLPNPNEASMPTMTRSSEAYGFGVANAEPQARRARPKAVL